MISAATFKTISETLARLEAIVKSVSADAHFVFTETDGEHIYFNVVGKASQIGAVERDELRHKTAFEVLQENLGAIYKMQARVAIN